MPKNNIMSALRAAAPKPDTKVQLPVDLCEQILADTRPNRSSEYTHSAYEKRKSSRPARSFGWKRGAISRPGRSARTLVIAAITLIVVATTAAASFNIFDLPAPGKGGGEVIGPTGYVVYWRHGVLSEIVNCSKTRDAIECRGDEAQQSVTDHEILRQTERLWANGEDPSAAVLFMTADGGELSCAGAVACSYMKYEPNFLKPLPPVGTPIPPQYRKSE